MWIRRRVLKRRSVGGEAQLSLGGAWRASRHAAWNECSLQREVGAEYIAQHFFYYTCETPTGSLASHLAHFPYLHIVPVCGAGATLQLSPPPIYISSLCLPP